ncbi:glycine zipper domain-containing protein [Rhodohalobacter mucosus]|nr:glycine zipper domain-containing protein [Rhodohalobacter mucosus]
MKKQKTKNIAIGAGLGIILGAVVGSAAFGLVLGAAVGAFAGPRIRKKLASRSYY